MPGNSFGDLFKITTFGESHGEAIGVIIDGCPGGLVFDEALLIKRLEERRPGANKFVSPRSEKDKPKVLSGLFEGKTTGAPIMIIIQNQDQRSAAYAALKDIYRPGHAQFTYMKKFGVIDHRGSGRASARETASRVAAGAVAEMILSNYGIEVSAYIKQVGHIECHEFSQTESDIFCRDVKAEQSIKSLLSELVNEGDSIGGIVACEIKNLPCGLGEPVFDRFEAALAHAMLSIPATKGFEIGSGFEACKMRGSIHNDQIEMVSETHSFLTNHAGGTLGGITTGQEVTFNVVFKPTSSIKKIQTTVTSQGQTISFNLPDGARHDPCVAIRGVVVVKAMAALVACDFLLKSLSSKVQDATCD